MIEEERLVKIEAENNRNKNRFCGFGKAGYGGEGSRGFHRYLYGYGQDFYRTLGKEKYLELLLGEINDVLAVKRSVN